MLKKGIWSLLFVICFFTLNVCSTDMQMIKLKKKEISVLADSINSYLGALRLSIKSTALYTESLYKNQDHIIKSVNKRKFKMSASGVFYKPINDSGSAVFISGYVPINESLKKVIYLTEPIDQEFKKQISRFPEISQIYYNDKSSCNRIYPFFDVLTQYEPKTDITSFNFYYLANEKNNPMKNSVWVNEPYIDPAGRGWMISSICPVYYNDKLEGVVGLDFDIDRIIRKYSKSSGLNYLVMMNDGLTVSCTQEIQMLLDLPDSKSVKYIETIVQDKTRTIDFNLLNNNNNEVRSLAENIMQNKKYLTATFNNKIFYVIIEDVKETNWKLVVFIKK